MIVLVRPLAVPDSVVDFHLPALALSAILAGVLLARGRLGRPDGILLLVAYGVYLAGAIAVG